MFQRIQRTLKPVHNQALTQVHITRSSAHLHPTTGKTFTRNETIIVNTRQRLEAAIIARNRKHFAQAHNTPWHNPPFLHINSNTDYSLHSADGTPLDTTLCFPETETILKVLQERSTPHQWSHELSFRDFISGLLHWRESTSTSPSGRHLGVYKALVTAHINSSGEFDGPPPPLGSRLLTPTHDSEPTTQEKATQILQSVHSLAALAHTIRFLPSALDTSG